MIIEEISKGKQYSITIQRQRSETRGFLDMINLYDPFIHEMPIWQNGIKWLAELATVVNVSSGRYSASCSR